MKNRHENHLKLVCDIGELIDLFADVADLEMFLQKIVVLISEHMQSEVCSIYLFYEQTQELILKATKGLSIESTGKVRLKFGEGLTGKAFKERMPVCEPYASKSSQYRYFPGIGEENYDSFLAVPILRGMKRIGVIVVQNSKKNYFNEKDIKVLKAITSQLANTIETAKMLMIVNEKYSKKETPKDKRKKLKFFKGKIGSEGISIAKAHIVSEDNMESLLVKEDYEREYNIEDFYKAVSSTEEQLKKLEELLEEKLPDIGPLLFTPQLLMLKDREFINSIIELIEKGINPPKAITTILNIYVDKFNKMSDQYLRERSHDVLGLGKKLLSNLVGFEQMIDFKEECIVIAKELYPAELLKLSLQETKGIILLTGGITSHLSILARSLKIPLIICDNPELLNIEEGTKILLDAEIGNIYIDPSKEIIDSFKGRNESQKNPTLEGKPEDFKTVTKDGKMINLRANINLLGDVKVALNLNSDGVGLYRTEFPFIVRSGFPSEEEQFVIYQKLIRAMPNKQITFRTLDIGGDKVLSYYHNERENNPFLGIRSIRFSLKHKDIFAQQIRAVLRAGVGADIRIMFPMISSLDEFLAAKKVIYECIEELEKDNIKHKSKLPIGLMIELPSVLEIINDIAREADFLSIGTNDFVQYMLAVDRTNEKVADLYLSCHPAVLRGIKKVVDAAKKHNKPICICGDMAHEEKSLQFLLGIGIVEFSVDFTFISKVRELIAKVDLKDAAILANEILTKSKITEIQSLIN